MLKVFDLAQLGGGVSIRPGTNTDLGSTDVNGAWVSAGDTVGPVQAVCSTGAATGSPTGISVTFEMWEADDSSGTNAQLCADQRKPTLTAVDSQGILAAQTSKPYVKVKVEADDSALTGGSSPTLDIGANVLYSKLHS
jgi:hypothetical protein